MTPATIAARIPEPVYRIEVRPLEVVRAGRRGEEAATSYEAQNGGAA